MARDQEGDRSVFDFIYVDANRISLYLSQFSEFGSLTNLVRSVETTDDTEVGLNLKIAHGKTGEGQRTAVQRQYDTQWVAPLTFLEELQHRDMIKRDVDNAAIGEIILLSGRVSLIDMKMFERTWQAVAEQTDTSIASGNRRDRRAAKSRGQNIQEPPALNRTGLRLLGSLDQPLFLNFASDGKYFWSNALSDCVVGDSKGLALKHGLSMAGTWFLLAILDCLPEDNGDYAFVTPRVCGDAPNPFSSGVITILRELKAIMGRPQGYYGVTPLLIFREVT